MRGFRRRRVFGAVVLVSVLLLVPAFSLFAVQSNGQGAGSLVCQVLIPCLDGADGYPVVSKAVTWGDKTVDSAEDYSNVEIVLNGNLTIAGGGILRLMNVTLRVNCTANGSNRIEVQSGGALYINDTDGNPSTKNDASVITALNTSYRYLF